jgi:deoxyribonuclease-4
MNTIIFGTAGIPLTTPNPNTLNGILHLKTLDLDALELEFVKKVYLTEKTAPEVAQAAKESNISLSAHAPYYLNMNAAEPEKLARSRTFLFRAAQIASLSGARNLVFHAGYYLSNSPEDTFDTILSNTSIVSKKLKEADLIINLSPETSGKATQFGTLEEVLKLCTSLDQVTPCVDFAHLHAYSGKVNTYDEFVSILNRIKEILGKEALDNLHMHVSGIHYGSKGELKHLLLDESDFNYPALLQALIDTNTGGVMICESPSIEDDALRLKATYYNLKAKS